MKLPQKYQDSMKEDANLSDEERQEKRKRSSTPLPEGTYVAVCVKTEDIPARDGKMPQVLFKWRVLEPEEDNEGEDLTKRQIWDYVSMSDNASWRMRQIFDAAGYEYHSDTDELADEDAEVIIRVTHREIEQGKRKGEIVHQAEEYFSPDAGVEIGFDAQG